MFRDIVSKEPGPPREVFSETSAAYLAAPDTIERVAPLLGLARAFFAQDRQAKDEIRLGLTDALCGYVGPDQEFTGGQVDRKESLEFAQARVVASGGGEEPRLLAKNLWPSDARLPGFERAWSDHHQHMSRLAASVLQYLVREGLLSLPADSLGSDASAPLHWRSRVLHYCAPGATLGQVLVAPHTDIALFNLLYIDEPGLEVQDAAGCWHPISAHDGGGEAGGEAGGELVLLFGELGAHVSGGAIRPCMHRVLAGSAEHPRMSVPFFVYPPLTSPVPSRLARPAEGADSVSVVPSVQDVLLQRIRASWPQCFAPTPTAAPEVP